MSQSHNQKARESAKTTLKASTKRRNRRYSRIYTQQIKAGQEPKKEVPAYKRRDDLWNYD